MWKFKHFAVLLIRFNSWYPAYGMHPDKGKFEDDNFTNIKVTVKSSNL